MKTSSSPPKPQQSKTIKLDICPCGCPDIQQSAWMWVNTSEIDLDSEPPTERYWCPDCDMRGNDGDFIEKNAHKVEIAAPTIELAMDIQREAARASQGDEIREIAVAMSVGEPLTLKRHADDGFGTIYLVVESLGPIGWVRAQSFEEAYEAACDDIFYPADDDADADDESVGYRPNGPSSAPWFKDDKGMYQEDINGSVLWPLEECRRRGMTVHVAWDGMGLTGKRER